MFESSHVPLRLQAQHFILMHLYYEVAQDRAVLPGSRTVATVAVSFLAQDTPEKSTTNGVTVVCRGRATLASPSDSTMSADHFVRGVDRGIQLCRAENLALIGSSRSSITAGPCNFQHQRSALRAANIPNQIANK